MFRFEHKVLSRKGEKGGSRTPAAALAYRLGARLVDEHGEAHDYAKKSVTAHGFLGNDGGGWAREPQTYADAVAHAEKRKDAAMLRDLVLTLDRRIPAERQAQLVECWARAALPPSVGAFYAVHRPRALDGGQNAHAHVTYCDRPIGRAVGELGAKIRETPTEKKATLERMRAAWAATQNAELERLGFDPDLEHRARRREPGEPAREPRIGTTLYSQTPAAIAHVERVMSVRRARAAWRQRLARAAETVLAPIIDRGRRAAVTEALLADLATRRSSLKKESAPKARKGFER